MAENITRNRPKLLIVDDEENINNLLGMFFDSLGFDVDCAQELDEAAALVANVHYELVITDLNLSRTEATGGLGVLSWIREVSPGTRMILHTALCTAAVEAEAVRHGVDAILLKPQPLSHLASVASRLLK